MQNAAQVVFPESRILNPESYPFLRNQATIMITPSQILNAESRILDFRGIDGSAAGAHL